MERRRLKDKITAALPKKPKKKVVIINNLPKSSTTRKVLKAKGIMKPPEEELQSVSLHWNRKTTEDADCRT